MLQTADKLQVGYDLKIAARSILNELCFSPPISMKCVLSLINFGRRTQKVFYIDTKNFETAFWKKIDEMTKLGNGFFQQHLPYLHF